MTKFTIRVKGKKVGTYSYYQVAMNHAYDLLERYGWLDGFNKDQITINKKPLSLYM